MAGPKVWIIADYSGNLHEVPFNTQAYFRNRNVLVKDKTKQYKFIQESTGSYIDEKGQFVEGEALKFIKANKGVDPKYIAPKDMVSELASKDADIEKLRKELEALKNPAPAKADTKQASSEEAATITKEETKSKGK